MKFSIEQRDLAIALARVARVCDRKSTMPILANVLIEATAGKLTFKATDLYRASVATVDAVVDEPGSVCVPAQDLQQRIENLEGNVRVRTDESKLHLTAGSRKYQLHTVNADNFPPLPVVSSDKVMTVDPTKLRRAMAVTTYCMGKDDTRAHIASLLLTGDGKTLTVVATDGHRLAKATTEYSGPAFEALLPRSGASDLFKLLDRVENGVLVAIDSVVSVVFGWGVYYVKQVDAQFPAWEQVVPRADQCENTATFPRQALISSVKAVAVSSNEKTGGVKLRFNRGGVAVSSESPDRGNAQDEVPAEYDGKTMTVVAHSVYLIEPLSAVEDDEVRCRFSGELDPMVFSPVGSEDWLAVVMPMRM